MKLTAAATARGSGCAAGGTHVRRASSTETRAEGNSFPRVSRRSVGAWTGFSPLSGRSTAMLMGATRASATPFARKSGTAR